MSSSFRGKTCRQPFQTGLLILSLRKVIAQVLNEKKTQYEQYNRYQADNCKPQLTDNTSKDKHVI
jgi:hypothetical protein